MLWNKFLSDIVKYYVKPYRFVLYSSFIWWDNFVFFRYASLLSQYSAVSFGDPLFGCFVILPLTQSHDIKFRRAVWDEHIGVLRALAIPLDQVAYYYTLTRPFDLSRNAVR